MDFVPPAASLAAPPPVRYAGFWLRWVACVVDSIALSVPILVPFMFAALAGIVSPGHEQDPSPATVVFLLLFVPFSMIVTWLYFAFLESSPGQGTLGKRLLGLRVTDYEGRRIGFGRATGRYWSKFLSGIPFNLGYVMAAFTQRKQALHDMIAKTLVVRR